MKGIDRKTAKIFIIVASVLGLIVIGIGFTLNFVGNKVVGDSEIKRVSITADVLDDGSFTVSENFYYDTSDINGIRRTFEYNQFANQSMSIQSVLVNGVESQRVPSANNGDIGVYTFEDNQRTQQVKIYQQTKGETTFTINYRVQGILSEYADVQDFNWKMYDTLGATTPLSLDATITFPQKIAQDDVQVFGHGDVEGAISIIDRHVIKVDITGFYPDAFAEVRVLLPNNPLANVTNKSNEKKLDSFLAYEAQEAHKTNEQIIENAKRKDNTFLSLIGLLIFWLVSIAFVFITLRDLYHKYDREKYVYEVDYYRETPSYSPAVAALVLNSNRDIEQGQLIATIFNLYVEKFLDLADLNKDVKIKLLRKPETILEQELDKAERWVFEWLWQVFPEGEGTYKTFFNIDKRTVSRVTKFETNFNRFKGLVQHEYRAFDFERYNGRNQKLPNSMRFFFFLFLVSIGLFGLWTLFETVTVVPLVISVILTALFSFSFGMLYDYKNNAYQLTEEGARQNAYMKGLKNYLNDYSLLTEAAPTAVHLWEKYFVYGLALGVTKEALNKLYQRIPQASQEQPVWQTLYIMNNLSYRYNIVHRSQRAVGSMTNFIDSKTMRTVGSAGFGGGGGFSGGGGFGGGGGGSSSF